MTVEKEELNQEQLEAVAGGQDGGQYYKLGRQQSNNTVPENPGDDKELSDHDLSQVSGGSGDGGQYYRLGDRKES